MVAGRWLFGGEDPGWNSGLSEAEALAGQGGFLIDPQINPSTHLTRLRAGFAQDRFVWVNEPHVKRGAKRNGCPAYVGAFCFYSSLPFDPFDFAQGRLFRS